MTTQNIYLHGHLREEQTRLSLLNEILNPDYLEQVGPWSVTRIIDFGCGLGHIAREIKKRSLRDTVVIGLDRDEQQLATARELTPGHEVEFVHHDVLQRELKPEWLKAFDIAHARFLLEHMPHPSLVVNKMASSIRDGGRVILADDDHSAMQLYPTPPGFIELWTAYEKTYEVHGNDPHVGRKLVYLLRESGLKPAKNGFVFFGSCAGNPQFSKFVTNLVEVIAGAKELLLNHLLDAEAYDRAITGLSRWALRDDAAIWYPLYYAVGLKQSA